MHKKKNISAHTKQVHIHTHTHKQVCTHTHNTEVRELLRRLIPMVAIMCPRPLSNDMEVDAAPP